MALALDKFEDMLAQGRLGELRHDPATLFLSLLQVRWHRLVAGCGKVACAHACAEGDTPAFTRAGTAAFEQTRDESGWCGRIFGVRRWRYPGRRPGTAVCTVAGVR